MPQWLSFFGRIFGKSKPIPESKANPKKRKTYTASICGHNVELITKVDVFGKEITMQLDEANAKNIRYCPQCLAKMSIKCVKCQEYIMVGDPIVLYTPKEDNFQAPEHVGTHEEGGAIQYVGCLRWDCAISGAFRAGFWTDQGNVKRVASPMEIAMATNSVAACSDISDPKQAIPFPEKK